MKALVTWTSILTRPYNHRAWFKATMHFRVRFPRLIR